MDSHGGGAFCVAGDSLINYEFGTSPISELKDIEEGTLIKTDISTSPISNWFDNGRMQTIIIETEEGYKLEGSSNQNIRVIDEEGNYVWRRLDSLKTNDWIAIQRKDRLFGSKSTVSFSFKHKKATRKSNEFKFPDELTEDYAYLMGLLIGDGRCTSQAGIQICVCEEEMKKIVQNLYVKLFGDKGNIYGHWAHYCGVELREYLLSLGLDYLKSWEKQVPKSVFNAPKPVVSSFLRGLFDTDGTVRKTGRNMNSIEVNLASSSKLLIHQVQQLLLNFGIISTILEVDAKGRKSVIDGRIVESKRTRYHLRLKGNQSIRIYKKEIGFGLPRKSKILNSIDLTSKRDLSIIPNQKSRLKRLWDKLSPKEHQEDKAKIGRLLRDSGYKGTKELTYAKLAEFLDSYKDKFDKDPDFEYLRTYYFLNHYYSKIKTISKSENQVYDFEVPGIHTFTANGFICHNSGKDPSKVDRSGSYYARYAAKNIVAAGLADKCEVQVSYAIGEPTPLALNIECFGTEKVPIVTLRQAFDRVFDFRPGMISKQLNLKRPIFKKTAVYGHFGRDDPDFTWERTDKVEELKRAIEELTK
ncbi:MAG: methionine adenosyltransferase domain-containing protein [Candidatus Heimdallarchaeaceae archaeon]